jgi:hypothetical protein
VVEQEEARAALEQVLERERHLLVERMRDLRAQHVGCPGSGSADAARASARSQDATAPAP